VGLQAGLAFGVVGDVDRLELDLVCGKKLFRAQAAASARLVVELDRRHRTVLRGYAARYTPSAGASTVSPTASAAGETTVDGWMNSPPHRASILTRRLADTGVGCYTGTPATPKPQLGVVIVCVAVYGTPK